MGKRVIVETHHDLHQHHNQITNNSHHHVTTPVTTTTTPGARNIRKRKCNTNSNKSHKTQRLSSSPGNVSSAGDNWRHDNDDEDSSSNDGPPLGQLVTGRSVSSKQANNSSILLNNSFNLSFANNTDQNASLTESPKPVYTLRPSVINGTILYDLNQKPWRLGRPIGKGNFGEIFLASDIISIPVTNENANFVVKIEPHSNGPLFVEIHCLMNTANREKHVIKTENERSTDASACCNLPQGEPSGIPNYIASGSHYFGNARYRFLVLPRFDRDLHSLIKKSRVHQKSVLTLAIHIINVLENLHDRGYCHNDVKAQNLMLSKCKYLTHEKEKTSSSSSRKKDLSLKYTNKSLDISATNGEGNRPIKSSAKYDHYEEKQQTTDSGNSSEQEANDEDDDDEVDKDRNDDDNKNYIVKRNMYNKIVNNNNDNGEEDDDYHDSNDGESETDEDDEDFDDGDTTNSTNSNSMDNYHTPKNPQKKRTLKPSRNVVEYSGSNPVRSCRKINGEKQTNSIYDEMVKSHYLRPAKRVSYMEFFSEDNNSVTEIEILDSPVNVQSNTSDAESEEFQPPYSIKRSIKKTIEARSAKKPVLSESRRLTRRQEKILGSNKKIKGQEVNDNKIVELKKLIEVEEERIFLIDYGLASKYIDNGVHRPFVMDQRRAHDGTLEYTSRDAHMGAHSRRSDMECLGYNLLFWSQGYLPWKEAATNQQQEKVHRAKEYLMTDVRELLRQIYGKQVPKYLGEYLHMVGQLAYHERPNYKRYRRLFEKEYEQLGYNLSEMSLQMREIQRTCVRVKEEIENKNDFFDMTKNNGGGVINVAYSVMHMNIGGCGTPFHERTLSNRVSPKNLRSKSDKKGLKKKKFSWAEILSQDPDQIARERAEKEFDREEELGEVQETSVRRYQGKPTYAIVEILERMGRSVAEYEQERDLEELSKIQIKKTENNQISMDVCDYNEPMDVSDADESDDADETDSTESSLRRRTTTTSSNTTTTTTKSKSQRQIQKSQNSSAVSGRTKTKATVSRKLELKTPGSSGTAEEQQKTPVCKRVTRCQKASIVKIETTPQIMNTTPISSLAAVKGTSATAKSIKRGSATTSKSSRKIKKPSALASQELEQPAPSSSSKRTSTRERRARRCILKTEQQQQMSSTEGLLDDDSNSNFTPDDGHGGGGTWKGSNYQQSYGTAYSRKK